MGQFKEYVTQERKNQAEWLTRRLSGKVIQGYSLRSERHASGVHLQSASIYFTDGATLTFKASAECCSEFEVDNLSVAIKGAAITNVTATEVDEISDNPGGGDDAADYRLVILAQDRQIGEVDITGQLGSGYYLHVIDMDFSEPRLVEGGE